MIGTNTVKRLFFCGGGIAALLLLCGCQVVDMVQFGYANANASHRWLDGGNATTVAFELVDDHIVVPVRVNGSEPLNFVLDSGAGAMVIFESRNSNKIPLEMGAQVNVSGVGTGPDPQAFIVSNTNLSVGSAQVESLSVIYLPLDSVPFFDNFDEVYFDGVIGAPFFERFIVEIDYDQQLISFSEPGSAQALSERLGPQWQEVPLQIQSGVPYVQAQFSTGSAESIAVKLLLDTGYRGPLSLTPDTHDGIEEPGHYFAIFSQGLSGDVESRVALSESLNIGGFALNKVPVSYSVAGGESDNGANGLLGNEVLKHFNLVFDYPNERLMLSANQQFDTKIALDRSGLLIRPHRLGAVVKSIAPDTSAQASDLRLHDIITSFDAQPVTRANISLLKGLLASGRDKVALCWLSEGVSHCGDLALASRFGQHTL